MSDQPRCRFCGALAVGRFSMPAGCVCFPDDREQCLCPQHVIRATPLGGMELVEDYTAEQVLERRIWP